MAYWTTRFGSTDLSQISLRQSENLEAPSEARALPGGRVFAPYGSEQAPIRLPYQISCEAEYVESTAETFRDALYALRALIGTRARLYRSPDGGTANSESVLAVLRGVRMNRNASNLLVVGVGLTFEVLEAVWRGIEHTEIVTLDQSPKTASLANGGNAIQRDIIATLTAAGSNITAFRLENLTAGHVSSINYAGTVAVGKQLVINCGLQTIVNNGVPDYAHLTFNTWHSIADWFRLAPGTNSIRITRTGGSVASTVAFSYHDAWA